jgi:hypothetical protein
MVEGLHTEFCISVFSNYIFIVVTQLQKLGTLVRVSFFFFFFLVARLFTAKNISLSRPLSDYSFFFCFFTSCILC